MLWLAGEVVIYDGERGSPGVRTTPTGSDEQVSDETDTTEDEIDAMMASGEPVSVGLFYDEDGNPVELREWCRRDRAERFHLITQLGRRRVSTVHLGLDHSWGVGPPLIFETMVFPDCITVDRYATKDAAIVGHNRAVEAAMKRKFGKVPRKTNRPSRTRLRRFVQMDQHETCPVKPSAAGRKHKWR